MGMPVNIAQAVVVRWSPGWRVAYLCTLSICNAFYFWVTLRIAGGFGAQELDPARTAILLGFVGAARIFPSLVGGIWVGTLLDRVGYRQPLIASVLLLPMPLLACSAVSLDASAVSLVGATFAVALIELVYSSSVACVVATLQDPHERVAANRFVSTSVLVASSTGACLAWVLGKLAAGVTLAGSWLLPEQVLFGLTGISVLFALLHGRHAALTCRDTFPYPAAGQAPGNARLARVWRWMVSVPTIAVLLLVPAAINVMGATRVMLLPIMTNDQFVTPDRGAWDLDTLLFVVNAASLLGTISGTRLWQVATHFVNWSGVATALVIVVFVAVLQFLLPMAAYVPAFLLVVFLIASATPSVVSRLETVWQDITPAAIRGRVNGVRRTISQSTGATAYMAFGHVETFAGTIATIWISASTAVALLVAAMVFMHWEGSRRHPSRTPV